MKKKSIILLSLLCLSCMNIFGQGLKPVAELVQKTIQREGDFTPVNLFSKSEILDEEAVKFAIGAQFLKVDQTQLNEILESERASFALNLTYQNENFQIDLVEVNVTTDDFKAVGSNDNEAMQVRKGRHYRGVIHGDNESLAAISFFENDVMGFVSSIRWGNLVIGKLQDEANIDGYILYADQNLTVKNQFNCAADLGSDDGHMEEYVEDRSSEADRCLRAFIEVDNKIYITKGNTQNTVNFVTGLYNQVATLYANEGITTVISEIFVWLTPDGYQYNNPFGSAGIVMGQFLANRVFFNGDMALLLGSADEGVNLGGLASFDVFCDAPFKHTFNHIVTSYENVPTYSWSVFVITHEIGHLLGSYHTQDCVWNGNQALDNCDPSPLCAPGPPPVTGGTIMSYCHLTPFGINFSNGFGPLPGDVIRQNYKNAPCLEQNCCLVDADGCVDCPSPDYIEVVNVSGNTITLYWNSTGATSYTLYYRQLGEQNWTSLGVVPGPYTVASYGPVPCGSLLEVAVRAHCDAGDSELSNGVIVRTKNCIPQCPAPVIAVTNTTPVSAIVSWQQTPNANQYRVRYKEVTSSNWTTIFVNANSYQMAGLNPSTFYHVQVNAVCGGNLSNIVTKIFSTSAMPVCSTPSGLFTTIQSAQQATAHWNPINNAVTYEIRYKLVSGSIWTTISNINYTKQIMAGLIPGQSYEVQVRTNCLYNSSAFSTSVVFTMPFSLISDPSNNDGFGNSHADHLILSPNPAVTDLTVIYRSQQNTAKTVFLMDFMGRIIEEKWLSESQSVAEFDIQALPEAIYWVRAITSDGKIIASKLLKQ